jgi:hypothetical protein
MVMSENLRQSVCQIGRDGRARSAKVEAGFASDRAQLLKTHNLFAKPLTLWRIMCCAIGKRERLLQCGEL